MVLGAAQPVILTIKMVEKLKLK